MYATDFLTIVDVFTKGVIAPKHKGAPKRMSICEKCSLIIKFQLYS